MSKPSSSKSVRHLKTINIQNEWETPNDIFVEACVDYHIKPKLDVCATHETAKCSNYFGPDQTMKRLQDGLMVPWKMDFFMNPPYEEVDLWMRKAIQEIWDNKVHGLILTYAKTDTKWWHDFVEHNPRVKPHFIKGRIRFHLNGKVGDHSAPYPSVWLVIK